MWSCRSPPSRIYRDGAEDIVFFYFSSFDHAPTIYRYDPGRAPRLWLHVPTSRNSIPSLVSLEGRTRIPMYLFHKRDFRLTPRDRHCCPTRADTISACLRSIRRCVVWPRLQAFSRQLTSGRRRVREEWHQAGGASESRTYSTTSSRRGMAGRQSLHATVEARDCRRQQWRPAGWRRADAASGSVSRSYLPSPVLDMMRITSIQSVITGSANMGAPMIQMTSRTCSHTRRITTCTPERRTRQ